MRCLRNIQLKAIVRQNGQFGSEIKMARTVQKALYNYISYSIQKTTGRNTQQSRNDKIMRSVKSGHFAMAIVRQNDQLGSKIKRSKNVQKTALQPH